MLKFIYDRYDFKRRKPYPNLFDKAIISYYNQHSDEYNYNTNTQKFIQKFMNHNTPYNGIFLWHGVGSGKTCTGITIAENFRNISINLQK